jgi:hypothetical protein
MSGWNTQRIEQLAPDASALKAGQGLARPAKWVTTGRDEGMLWGECQGSGAKPYQVRIDLGDGANKCSCPSRKLPCKHAIGLLLMLANGTNIPASSPPAFAAEWQAERARRAAAKAARQEAPVAPADPKVEARRAAQRAAAAGKRETLVEEGLALLDTALGDLIGQGLSGARERPDSYWQGLALRLVDCQAPGLSRRVRELADEALSSPDWQEQLLVGLGRLRLLVDACRRLPSLPTDLAAEVRTQVGWTQEKEELLSRAGTRGRWLVAAHRVTVEEKLRVQRTWLLCGTQAALLLDFAFVPQPLPAPHPVGQCLDAEVVYFDGVPPLRALVKQLHGRSGAAPLPAAQDVAAVQAHYGGLLAANPWLQRWPAVLGPVTPLMQDEVCLLIDAQGRALPTPRRFAHGWHLVAAAQGEPCQVFGEWDGRCFEPLSVQQHGRLYSLTRIEQLPVLSQVA